MKYRCSHCQSYFNRNQVVIQSRNRKQHKKAIYYWCKECNNQKVKNYYHTPRGKRVFKELNKRMYKKHREKILARSSLNQAVHRVGTIRKPTKCEVCLIRPSRVEGHHPDYSKWREVIWACPACHAKLDRDKRNSVNGVE